MAKWIGTEIEMTLRERICMRILNESAGFKQARWFIAITQQQRDAQHIANDKLWHESVAEARATVKEFQDMLPLLREFLEIER